MSIRRKEKGTTGTDRGERVSVSVCEREREKERESKCVG